MTPTKVCTFKFDYSNRIWIRLKFNCITKVTFNQNVEEWKSSIYLFEVKKKRLLHLCFQSQSRKSDHCQPTETEDPIQFSWRFIDHQSRLRQLLNHLNFSRVSFFGDLEANTHVSMGNWEANKFQPLNGCSSGLKLYAV